MKKTAIPYLSENIGLPSHSALMAPNVATGVSQHALKVPTSQGKKIIFSHHLAHCLPNGTYNVMELPPGG